MHHNILPVTNPALNPPGSIRLRPCGARLRIDVKFVVVILPRQQRPLEPITRFEALRRRDGHASLRQVRLELIEHGRSQSRGYVPCHARHHAPDGISRLANHVDPFQHTLRGRAVRTPHDVRVDVLHRKRVVIDVRRDDLLHLGNVRQHLHAVVHAQYLPRHGPGGDPSDRLARRGPSPPRDGSHTVLGIVRGVRVARAVCHAHVVFEVIPAALILVTYEHREGRTERDVLGIESGEYLDCVGLVPGRGDAGLAGPPAIEVYLDLVAGYGDAGRTAVEGHADAAAVGFSPRGDAEDAAEGVARAHGEAEGSGGGGRGQEAEEGELHGSRCIGCDARC
mmetsp:Transcript_36439/g.87879  ORF Transcript_36439/g.87879 Transcript_36439/m.87879 type:complete len:337 (-) Transcript_36439:101-1111(-)